MAACCRGQRGIGMRKMTTPDEKSRQMKTGIATGQTAERDAHCPEKMSRDTISAAAAKMS